MWSCAAVRGLCRGRGQHDRISQSLDPIGTSTQLSLDGIELLLDGQQSSTDAIDHLCKVAGPYFGRLYSGQRPDDFLAT